MSTPPSAAASSWRRATCLLALLLVAKALLLALRGLDGHGFPPLHAAEALRFVEQDLLLAATWLVCDLQLSLLAARLPRLERGLNITLWALYGAVALFSALNVLIARTLGTPLTAALLGATGAALSDSIQRYASVSNGLAFALLGALACWLPRRRRVAPGALVGLLVAALLAVSILETDLLGAASPTPRQGRTALGSLGDNATWALARSLLRGAGGLDHDASEGAVSQRSADLGAVGPARDLRRYRGVARGLNVLWVILESTGARYLRDWQRGADVTSRDPTPNLTALTRRALRFSNAYAAYPESIKGLWAQLCGHAPAPHSRAADYDARRLPCDSIAGQLARRGYRTAFFHSGRFAYLGMEHVVRRRGFQVLRDASDIESPHASSFGVDDRATAATLARWITRSQERSPVQPFFAIYAPIAGHHPYELPGGGPSPFGRANDKQRYLSDLYRGDLALGQLLSRLRRAGVLERTLIIVDGDHGEAFLQHPGNIAHSLHVYEENVHVPLYVVLPPHLAPERQVVAPQLASLTDVAPTILDLLGLELPQSLRGRSLLSPVSRPLRFFADHARTRLGLRHGRYKLLVERESDTALLFDLRRDPDEHRDISARHPARVRRYRRDLERWARAQRRWLETAGTSLAKR